MIKAAKKLKFLLRKRKKKKTHIPQYLPSTCHCWCPYSSTQPSAPPLPPWLETEQTHEAFFAAEVQPGLGLAGSSQAQFLQEDIVLETSSLYPITPADTTSYQQYMAPNPVYGVPVAPVAPAVRRERSVGLFGCFVKFGINLIRCFCPCFHIREVY
ncbi:hypothetical protein L1049_014890 [Liquidambar formosana]|uniref:Uncharacterized protein n=1 Tax=Liquidambar formosana TaxID=63359 RepID=A0AAP0X1D0_LIQFO